MPTNNNQHFKYTHFKDRSDKVYRERLLNLFKDIIALKTLTNKQDLDTWKQNFTINDGKVRSFDGIDYTHTLRLDFNGLAATTFLLGDKNKDIKSHSFQISQAFKTICGENFTKTLKRNKVSLRIRFVFPYVYSDFTMALMESLESEKGRSFHNRATSYNFEIERSLSFAQFEESKIKKDQQEALVEIQQLSKENPNLIISEPDQASHTMQVRFTVLPVTVCNLIVSNIAFTDPYLFSKIDNKHEILFYFPVIESSATDQSSGMYYALANSFDYYWTSELSFFCKDATHFDPEKKTGLHKMKTPRQILQSSFKHRILRTLHHLKKEKDDFKNDEIENWVENLKRRFFESCRNFEGFPHSNFHLENVTEQQNSDMPAKPLPLQKPKNSIEIGYNEKERFYFFNITVNEISFNQFKRKKEGSDEKVSKDIPKGYKILLHYCLLRKGILKKGSMLAPSKLDFKDHYKFIALNLKEVYKGEEDIKFDRNFISKNIISCDGTKVEFKIEDVDVVYNKEAFEILKYQLSNNKQSNAVYDVVPKEDLEDEFL